MKVTESREVLSHVESFLLTPAHDAAFLFFEIADSYFKR